MGKEAPVIGTRLAPELDAKVNYYVNEKKLFRSRSEFTSIAIREYINYLEAKESGKFIEGDLRLNPQRNSR